MISLCHIHDLLLCCRFVISSSTNPNTIPTMTTTLSDHNCLTYLNSVFRSVAFASIRDHLRQKQNEQASRKLSHRLVVGPDTRRASSVLTTPGHNTTTHAHATAHVLTTKTPTPATMNSTVMATSGGDTTTRQEESAASSSGSGGFGVEFIVSDLTVTAQRMEQASHFPVVYCTIVFDT